MKKATPEVQKLRDDAKLWWRIARAESKARFGGSLDAMERAIAAEKKLVALGAKPPRRPKGFEDHHAVRANPADKLAEHGIVTLGDLDRWITDHPQVVEKGPYAGQREFMSRYQALKQLVGESAAIEMLNNLAIEQCTPPPKGRQGKAKR